MSLMLDDDYPETLGLIANAAYTWLTTRLQLEHQPAAEAALSIADTVRKEIGGSLQYIPKGTAWELSKRDREIYSRFRGDNYDQLAREFHLTEMRIRQIIDRCRRADLRDRQAGLF